MPEKKEIFYDGEKFDKEKFDKINNEFKTESPRAVAILGCSYLDYLLNELLKKRLIEDNALFKKVIDNLTFERRINLCFLVGSFKKRVQEDLLIINNIRNDFTHKVDINSFNIKKISSKCDKLQIIDNIREDMKSVNFDSPRIKYTASVIHYMATIELFTSQACKRIEENK